MRRRGLVLLGLGMAMRAAGAAELPVAQFVMLERHDCPWCRRWLREVGEASWNASDLGRRAPLRRVDVAQGMPADLAGFAHWRFTPTFVLMQGGRELGRIIGYQGDLFFWQQAEALLAKLPPADTARKEETQ
ncbi:transcriptional regulator [Roseicella aerolata]|uniref:Transcriptional regulator n=1 Tax=Roseicella aerolata TaxID=2883479 RepID=A0A9X1IFV3_9PROT|nr:transcriptional regulator [Roseicella aerolata]MCB4823727.1 transcriptional regulator [Roseicella aerolata]